MQGHGIAAHGERTAVAAVFVDGGGGGGGVGVGVVGVKSMVAANQ